ncbi:MAG: efflux RND transporter periplasmic adaptor subunit [Flavihumibacter sp.]
MRKYYWIPLLLLAACADKKPAATTAKTPAPAVANEVALTAAQIANAGIVTGVVKDTLVSTELVVNGMVDVPPQNIVSVSFPMGGYLRSTKLLPGMHIYKGEVIGVIEDQSLVQLQQDYLVTKSKLDYLQKDYARQKMLNEHKVNADKVYQQAATELRSQEAILRGYEEKLRLIGIYAPSLTTGNLSRSVVLRSPINGYVSKVNVNIGKYVNPTDVLFELINPDDMHGALTVFEKDINKIRVGQKVEMEFVDAPGKTYEGEVIIFSRNVGDDRSGTVHCHFETKPKTLMPGMFLNARIFLDKKKALTVPSSAIVRTAGKQYLFEQLDSSRFHLVEVQVDTVNNGQLAVRNESEELRGKNLVLNNAYAVLGAMLNRPEED